MKKLLLLSISLSALLLANSQAHAIEGQISATIIRPLSITQAQALNFGTIAVDAAGGNITLEPSGSFTGGSVHTTLGGSQTGQFAISGDPNRAFTLALQTTPVTLKKTGDNTKTMTVQSLAASTGVGSLTLESNGTKTVDIGGTLVVGANQETGDYTGTYTVTAIY